MSNDNLTRRNLLRTGAAASGTVALGSLTGCLDSVPVIGGGGGGGSVEPSNSVPSDSDTVITMNINAMVTDSDMRDIANSYFDQFSSMEMYSGPQNVDEALNQIENEAGLDPRGLSQMGMFTKTSFVDTQNTSPEYFGMLFDTDWSESDLIDAIESEGGTGSLTSGEYNGQTIYESEMAAAGNTPILGVMGDGSFVLGTRQAAEDAIDVSAGDAEAVSGDLLDAYNNTNDGYMRFASVLPEGSAQQVSGGGQMSIEGLDQVTHLSGSFYKNSGNFGMKLNMLVDSSGTATELAENMDGLITTAGMAVDEQGQQILDKIETSSSGSTASISYEESVDQIKQYLDQYVTDILGMQFGGAM